MPLEALCPLATPQHNAICDSRLGSSATRSLLIAKVVACRALSKVLNKDAATSTFQNLARKLTGLLQKPSAVASPALPAALKALGTLGQVAPAVFAEHVSGMADFVLDELLEAPVSSISPGKAKHLKAPVEGKTGTSPHQGIVLKMLGLKVIWFSRQLCESRQSKAFACTCGA